MSDNLHSDPSHSISTTAFQVANTTTLGAIAASVFNYLPPLLSAMAAIAGTAWSLLMIYESATFRWLATGAARRHNAAQAAKPEDPTDD